MVLYMTSKYIKIKMTPMLSGNGGSFITTATFRLDNVKALFQNIPVKIDTGCSLSTIPLARFRTVTSLCNCLKSDDIVKNVKYQVSYGVETGGQKHILPETYSEKMCCSALKFQHFVSNFAIGGLPIEQNTIYVNYDRKGNILIGMDILKSWDIHIGTIESGETIFLGCPKSQWNSDYFIELERLFGIKRLFDRAE